MQTDSYFFRREPCPYCGQGPLIFVSCRSCGSMLAWCGEQDHAVGRYDGRDLRELGTGETRDWAHEGCPVCKSSQMEYSNGEEVRTLGFTSTDVLLCQPGGDYVENPEL